MDYPVSLPTAVLSDSLLDSDENQMLFSTSAGCFTDFLIPAAIGLSLI